MLDKCTRLAYTSIFHRALALTISWMRDSRGADVGADNEGIRGHIERTTGDLMCLIEMPAAF